MSISRARTLRQNQTGPERAIWRILWHFRDDGWHFRRQQSIGPYYADFACLHAKLVVEVDGETHVDQQRDATRDEYMRSRGIQVLRFTNDDVLQNETGVYAVIAGVLGAVASTQNTPHPVPPPQGGRRPSQSTIATSAPNSGLVSPSPNSGDAVGSPSPLRGGDRGGGTLPALDSPGSDP